MFQNLISRTTLQRIPKTMLAFGYHYDHIGVNFLCHSDDSFRGITGAIHGRPLKVSLLRRVHNWKLVFVSYVQQCDVRIGSAKLIQRPDDTFNRRLGIRLVIHRNQDLIEFDRPVLERHAASSSVRDE